MTRLGDCNCDLGEGESSARTRALMKLITSANIATGGHAGDIDSMARCVRYARQFEVKVGAHPGYFDRENFGRKRRILTPEALSLLVLQQTAALQAVCRVNHVPLHHIKLHGALYNLVETSNSLARAYLSTVGEFFPEIKIYALAGGAVVKHAVDFAVEVWPEAFADRRYSQNGSLAPREQPGSVYSEPRQVRAQVRSLIQNGAVVSDQGTLVPIHASTVCVHGDGDNAVALARTVRSELGCGLPNIHAVD